MFNKHADMSDDLMIILFILVLVVMISFGFYKQVNEHLDLDRLYRDYNAKNVGLVLDIVESSPYDFSLSFDLPEPITKENNYFLDIDFQNHIVSFYNIKDKHKKYSANYKYLSPFDKESTKESTNTNKKTFFSDERFFLFKKSLGTNKDSVSYFGTGITDDYISIKSDICSQLTDTSLDLNFFNQKFLITSDKDATQFKDLFKSGLGLLYLKNTKQKSSNLDKVTIEDYNINFDFRNNYNDNTIYLEAISANKNKDIVKLACAIKKGLYKKLPGQFDQVIVDSITDKTLDSKLKLTLRFPNSFYTNKEQYKVLSTIFADIKQNNFKNDIQ